jgi:hypothetical protein
LKSPDIRSVFSLLFVQRACNNARPNGRIRPGMLQSSKDCAKA